MPQFEEHIRQALSNLKFLETINASAPDHHDWQVTACFYTALHFVNAHIAKIGLQYRTHHDVTNAINPENTLSIARIPEEAYQAYMSMLSLSRRSRYLTDQKNPNTAFTYDKHVAKAIRHLNKIMDWFEKAYPGKIPTKCPIRCAELKPHEATELAFFEIFR